MSNKNLLLNWHHGERWFWNCLVDADLASNSASWQWVAGCGADAAPYFRIFNPVTQGEKFDPEGEYIKKYIPELSNLPNKYLYSPWEAPKEVLTEANIVLGKDYPKPIVELKVSRERALEAFKSLKKDISSNKFVIKDNAKNTKVISSKILEKELNMYFLEVLKIIL